MLYVGMKVTSIIVKYIHSSPIRWMCKDVSWACTCGSGRGAAYSLKGWRMLGKGRVKNSSYFSSTCFPCTNLSDSEFLQNVYEEVSSINI